MKKFADKNRKALFGVVLAAALALAAAPAMAQPGYGGEQGAAQQGMQAQQPAKQDFDQPTLQKFASASAELGKIQTAFAQKLKGVQDQEEARGMQQKMHDEMVNAVQDKGLQVQEYNAIANQMSVDAELRKKVEQMRN